MHSDEPMWWNILSMTMIISSRLAIFWVVCGVATFDRICSNTLAPPEILFLVMIVDDDNRGRGKGKEAFDVSMMMTR